ncbi:MAG TPA: hypothetical protein DCM73_01945 [Clostridiales bacterium]|nr:hypothetical protein [Clostridiales bacterium]
MTNSLISPDNTWVLWAFLTGWAAFSIYLEQKYQWAAKVSGAIIALVGAMALSNFKIIPTEAPAYDVVWSYVVPLAIPLLLLQCNIKKIWKESGRMLLIFLIGSVGTVTGAIVGFKLLGKHIPHLAEIAGMMTGSYIGGGVNFVAVSSAFKVPGELVSATVVADNLLMALYFLTLITIPTLNFFRKHFRHPYVDQVESIGVNEGETSSAAYWKGKEISLKDLAFAIATSFIVVAVSQAIADFFAGVIPTTNMALNLLNVLLGNQYLIITTVTMLLATFFPGFFGNINGVQEIGTFLIYLFFVVIGVPASIPLIIQNSPLLLVFCGIVVLVNMTVSFALGKIFNYSVEEIIIASNANIGGPTTATAMAISKGWTDLVPPAMLVGVFGYGVGTYLGILVGNLLL